MGGSFVVVGRTIPAARLLFEAGSGHKNRLYPTVSCAGGASFTPL